MKFLLMFKPIFNFLLANLVAIHKGTMAAKFKASFVLAFYGAPVVFTLEKATNWYIMNYAYVSFTLIAIMFDHFLGTWVHWLIIRDFSWKKNITGFFTKVSLVFVGAVLVEGIVNILKPGSMISDYFQVMSRLVVFIYPAGSAFMNCSIVTNGKFPPTALMQKISQFNKDLDPRVFGKAPDKEDESI